MYRDNIFEDLRELFENKFDITINTLTITSAGYVIGSNIQPQREILSILSKRKDGLFENVKRTFVDNVEDVDILSKKIDIHTGDEDENEYKIITNLIIEPRGFSKYLNYQKCCNEVKRINSIIKKNSDSLYLLEGI